MSSILFKEQCHYNHIFLWNAMIDTVKTGNLQYDSLEELKKTVFEDLFPFFLYSGRLYNYCFGCIYSNEDCDNCIFDLVYVNVKCLNGLWGICCFLYVKFYLNNILNNLYPLISIMEQVRDFPIKKD
jgi:hypothetical protein